MYYKFLTTGLTKKSKRFYIKTAVSPHLFPLLCWFYYIEKQTSLHNSDLCCFTWVTLWFYHDSISSEVHIDSAPQQQAKIGSYFYLTFAERNSFPFALNTCVSLLGLFTLCFSRSHFRFLEMKTQGKIIIIRHKNPLKFPQLGVCNIWPAS